MEQALLEWMGTAAAPALFLCLLSTGVPGLPVAEEAVLLAAGALAAGDARRLVGLAAVACLGLLVADTALFRIGAALGPSVFSHPQLGRVLTAARVARVRRAYDRFGAWAVFAARFTPGLRMPSFVLAGAFGVRQSRFWLADGLGVLVYAPLLILLGAWVGPPALSWVRAVGGWAGLGLVLAAAAVAAAVRLRAAATSARASGDDGAKGAGLSPRG